jgi:hypothetical protein
LHRRDHPEGEVASTSVVNVFDPVADGELSCHLSGPQVLIEELDFIVAQNDSCCALSQHTAIWTAERTAPKTATATALRTALMKAKATS